MRHFNLTINSSIRRFVNSSFLLLLLVPPPVAYSQVPAGAIVGAVVDARTSQALDGVLVEVAARSQSTTTDAEGRFRFDGLSPATYELHISPAR